MTQSLSADEFERIQNQLIDLKTANYSYEERARRTTGELTSLRQKLEQLEKELEKSNKIISKSKKAKDVAAVVEESEGLQRKLHHMEEEYQLQSKTLMEELSRLSQDNETLKQQLPTGRVGGKESVNETDQKAGTSELEGEVQWLQAVNKTLEKTLQSTKGKYEAEIADLKKSIGLRGRSPQVLKRAVTAREETDGAAVSLLVSSSTVEHAELASSVDKDVDEYLSTSKEDFGMITAENESLRKQLLEKEDLQLKFDTLEEEKKLLVERSKTSQEKNEKRISSLEAEAAKLNDKLRRKQEILLQLQDEKEKQYADSKTSLSDAMAAKEREIHTLIEQAAKIQGELDKTNQRFQEMQQRSQLMVKDLQASLTASESQARGNTEESSRLFAELRQKNSDLTDEIASLKDESQRANVSEDEAKKRLSEVHKNIEDLAKKNALLIEEASSLKAQLQQSERAQKQLTEQKDFGSEEKEQALRQLDEALRLAESRKTMADDMSRERERIVEESRRKMADMQQEHKASQRQQSEDLEKEKLKSGQLQLRVKQLEANEKEFSGAKAKVDELESQLQKMQDDLEKVRKEGEDEVDKAKQDAENAKLQIESLEAEKVEIEGKLSVQEQALLDKNAENKLFEKKSVSLMKDLKRQLQLERKRSERMQEQVSETKGKQSLDELFVPPSASLSADLHRPPSRDGSNSSTAAAATAGASSTTSLPDDTTDLLARLAGLREENWLLEERVAHLETNASSLAEDVLQKSAIIHQHYMDTKSRVGDWAHSPKQQRSAAQRMLTSLASPFKSAKGEQNLKEAVFKLQRVVEETLMKNIHLHQNIDMLVGEVARLQEENNRLLAGLDSSDKTNP
eukprot:m.47241 g.47241  ORF g.47241 m.47241 type:complete len:855 (+) comp33771_c0_seq6:68-2632(+)